MHIHQGDLPVPQALRGHRQDVRPDEVAGPHDTLCYITQKWCEYPIPPRGPPNIWFFNGKLDVNKWH